MTPPIDIQFTDNELKQIDQTADLIYKIKEKIIMRNDLKNNIFSYNLQDENLSPDECRKYSYLRFQALVYANKDKYILGA